MKTSTSLFSDTFDLPLADIHADPARFQGRLGEYSEDTVNAIVNKGHYDRSKSPITVWRDPRDKRFYILSGHSRHEAAKRIYASGKQPELASMPVKQMMVDDVDRAIEYAVLESNRKSTEEGLIPDLKAYRTAVSLGKNKEYLLSIFRPESRFQKLKELSTLNPNGMFVEQLAAPSQHSFPYLERNARWVGNMRSQFPDLSNGHERELFDYLYGSQKGLTINKQKFFDLVNSKVSRIDFDPANALNLSDRISPTAYTDPLNDQLKELDTFIAGAQKEIERHRTTLARAKSEGIEAPLHQGRVTLDARISELNGYIIRKMQEKAEVTQNAGRLERTMGGDLFSQVEPAPAPAAAPVVERQRAITEDEKMQFGAGYGRYEFERADIPTNRLKLTEDPSLSDREDLIADIKRNGIKIPIVVVADDSGVYHVKNGNHRTAIAKHLNIGTVPALIAKQNLSESDEQLPHVKGVTVVEYEDGGKTLVYGTKTVRTRVSVVGLSQDNITEELDFERRTMAKNKEIADNLDKEISEVRYMVGLTSKEKADAGKMLESQARQYHIQKQLIIPFFQKFSQVEPAQAAAPVAFEVTVQVPKLHEFDCRYNGKETTVRAYDQYKAEQAAAQLWKVDRKNQYRISVSPGRPVEAELFRGGHELTDAEIKTDGISLTKSEEIGKYWAGSKVGGRLFRHKLAKAAKILTDIPKDILPKDNPPSHQDKERIVTHAKAKGYDGVDLSGIFNEQEVRIFNLKALEGNVSQGRPVEAELPPPAPKSTVDILRQLNDRDPEKRKEAKAAMKQPAPIRTLGTGSAVYYDSFPHYRVNDGMSGKVYLNVGADYMEVPAKTLEYDTAQEAVEMAKKFEARWPKGVPEGLDVVKAAQQMAQEETSPTSIVNPKTTPSQKVLETLSSTVDTKPGYYYVSAVIGGTAYPLLGPFVNDHRTALDCVDEVANVARNDNSGRGVFASYGTMRTEKGILTGKLNKWWADARKDYPQPSAQNSPDRSHQAAMQAVKEVVNDVKAGRAFTSFNEIKKDEVVIWSTSSFGSALVHNGNKVFFTENGTPLRPKLKDIRRPRPDEQEKVDKVLIGQFIPEYYLKHPQYKGNPIERQLKIVTLYPWNRVVSTHTPDKAIAGRSIFYDSGELSSKKESSYYVVLGKTIQRIDTNANAKYVSVHTPEADYRLADSFKLYMDKPMFKPREGTMVKLKELVSTKQNPERSYIVATARMMEAGYGDGEPRGPLNVEKMPDGRYHVKDGNATFEVARRAGWAQLPVIIDNDPATDILKKKKMMAMKAKAASARARAIDI